MNNLHTEFHNLIGDWSDPESDPMGKTKVTAIQRLGMKLYYHEGMEMIFILDRTQMLQIQMVNGAGHVAMLNMTAQLLEKEYFNCWKFWNDLIAAYPKTENFVAALGSEKIQSKRLALKI